MVVNPKLLYYSGVIIFDLLFMSGKICEVYNFSIQSLYKLYGYIRSIWYIRYWNINENLNVRAFKCGYLLIFNCARIQSAYLFYHWMYVLASFWSYLQSKSGKDLYAVFSLTFNVSPQNLDSAFVVDLKFFHSVNCYLCSKFGMSIG